MSAPTAAVAAPWDDGALVLELTERRLHELNTSAAAIFELWAQGVGRDEIVHRLVAAVDAVPAHVAHDVDAAIDGFVRAGLAGSGPDMSRSVPATGAGEGLGPYRAGQTRFRVACGEPWASGIEVLLAELRTEGAEAEFVLGVDETLEPDVAHTQLVARINELAVVGSPDWVAFHAGVVVIDGELVVLPGPSGRGKSTLTAALVAAGAEYLSDELALLDPIRGVVVPHPKPLALASGQATRGKELVDPRTFGTVGQAGPVAAVVAPTFVPGGPTVLEPIERRAAVDLLMANSFDFGPAGEAGFRALVDLAATVPVFRLQVCDLAEAVAAVAESVAAPLATTSGAGGRGHR